MGTSFYELINNVVLLIALSLISEVNYIFPKKLGKCKPVINGLLIGLIGIAIMTLPFRLSSGIFFDTRTILIGVAALMFGGVPTLIAVASTLLYRIIIGGGGVYMGIATILSAAILGLVWKRFVLKEYAQCRWFKVYLMGLAIHAVMLLCVMLLPPDSRMETFRAISLPVILIYPVATVLLSVLLLRQKEQSESVLRILEAENRYKSLFDYSHAVMLLLDPANGRIVDANRTAGEFYGWPLEKLRTMNMSEINKLSEEQIRGEMQLAVLEKKNYFLFKHKKCGGQVVDVEVYSSPIKYKGYTFLYTIVHDVSERTAAVSALKESEYLFRTLVEGSPDAIFIQTNKKFSFINKAGVQLFGAESREELIGKSVMERFHPDYHESITERIRQLNVEKKPQPPNETIFLKMDGSPVWVEIRGVPVTYHDMDGAIVFARDITEKKQQESANLEIEAQLRQQQKLEAIGTLAGGVAHEINNPINGIMNYAQLIMDSVGDEGPGSEYAGEIIAESERISVIVKNLLQFSRIEKQSHSYASVYDIVNQTVSLIRTVIKKDQIDFQISMQDGLPDIKCRSQQIQQVLMNLLTNARDALNEKYPEFDRNKIIRLFCVQIQYDGRRWIRTIVEDHGNGIPENIQEKIFEPFFSTKTKDKGTGLGLSISFGIVKEHHGKLFINTKPGEFTRFCLDLPVDNGWVLTSNS
jgi:PAS domain S-box-containing protein